MARADSTIRVNIIGDAKSLSKAADTAEGSVKGMNSQLVKVGGIVAGAFATREIIDFGQSALDEADRVADATGRLEKQLGDLSGPLIDAADKFSDLGQSEGDMLDLEARVADIGTAAGIADDKLAPFAQSAAELAAKMALATDTEADVWIEKIGKAAGKGDARALRDLGIFLDDAAVNARALADTGKPTVDALTDQDKAAATSAIVLEKLAEMYGTVGEGAGDFEQKQAELQAKMETLTGKIGEHLEGPLNDLLDFNLTGIEGWELFAEAVAENEQQIRELLTPLARAIDLLGAFVDLINTINSIDIGAAFEGFLGPQGGRNTGLNIRSPDSKVTINVQGGSPEVVEQAVRDAVNRTGRRG